MCGKAEMLARTSSGMDALKAVYTDNSRAILVSEFALNNLILERTKDDESERARRMRIGVARVEQRVAVRLEFIDANAEADVCNHLGMRQNENEPIR